jgi:type IV fimbrial biogenesis protein FimT
MRTIPFTTAGRPSGTMRPTRRRGLGFTLIELMVTLAVAAILLKLATPSMRQLLVRNTVGSMTNEFSTALSQARGLAIASNSCATLCTSTVTATGSPTCRAAGSSGYQGGWIVFLNPACDTAQTDPAAAGAKLKQARNGGDDGFAIVASDTSLNRLMFDPRGISTASAGGRFQVQAPDDSGNSYTRTICLDAAGRTTVRRYTATCS